jgi:arsenite methyltransferase
MSCCAAPNKSCCDDAPSTSEPSSCCSPSVALVDTSDHIAMHNTVQQYYGEELKTTDDLKTSACKTCFVPPAEIRQLIKDVPFEVTSKFYGCGVPLPLGIDGLRVLDLGCGSGRDCYVASRLVGQNGSVTGVDMTESQLDVARRNAEAYTRDVCKFPKPNMTFVLGEIEKLNLCGLSDSSQDIVISNCVINLSPDKPAVLREAYRVLGNGGEMYFSDVYCDRRLPSEVRSHPVMIGECLGGALYLNDFFEIAKKVGFTDPRCLSSEPISIDDPELQKVAGNAQFVSVTFRLFKVSGCCSSLEAHMEDYGQIVKYKGTIPGHSSQYDLDDEFSFPKDEAVPVDGNTAAILSSSYLASHFDLSLAAKKEHLGAWKLSNERMIKILSSKGKPVKAEDACCKGGSCC